MIEYANLIRLKLPPTVAAWSSVAGKKEGEGPMAPYFDRIEPDGHFGAETWSRPKASSSGARSI